MTPAARLRLWEKMERCIEEQDYESVFTEGACFIFASRLHERFGFKIRGICGGHGDGLSHVWCQMPDSRCVDVRGVYPEIETVGLAYGPDASKWGVQTEDVSTETLRTKITEMGYPLELKTKLLNLADWVFDHDDRFAAARL